MVERKGGEGRGRRAGGVGRSGQQNNEFCLQRQSVADKQRGETSPSSPPCRASCRCCWVASGEANNGAAAASSS